MKFLEPEAVVLVETAAVVFGKGVPAGIPLRQEYGCAFVDDAEALFSSELVAAAIDPGVPPLFGVAHAA